VSKAELGTKRICGSCGAKFYDLLKSQIVCPKCATVFVVPEPAPVRQRRGAQYLPPKDAVKARVAETEGVGEAVAAGAEEEPDRADDESDNAEEEGATEEKIDDAVLIVADEHDEGDDVGNILGNTGNKDEGS
jgi:uncharacterized protein (TIGR02300 family)